MQRGERGRTLSKCKGSFTVAVLLCTKRSRTLPHNRTGWNHSAAAAAAAARRYLWQTSFTRTPSHSAAAASSLYTSNIPPRRMILVSNQPNCTKVMAVSYRIDQPHTKEQPLKPDCRKDLHRTSRQGQSRYARKIRKILSGKSKHFSDD
jgi:hypothetical protein